MDSNMVASSSGRPDVTDEMNLITVDVDVAIVGRNFEKLVMFIMLALLSPALLLLLNCN